MAQSVELTFDAAADLAITEQWRHLADAGLPTAQRSPPSEHHRPHVTLLAVESIDVAAEARLPALLADLALSVRIGSALLFGPHRSGYVLVRQVVPSPELLDLQRAVAQTCGADPLGQFGPGRWTPHVTLARRMLSRQLGSALDVLDFTEVVADVRDCRRWDGERRTAWWLSG